MIHIGVTPVPKPRMTQRDKWAKRKCVAEYYTYKDEIKKHLKPEDFPVSGAHVTFFLPMPKSWSKKKKDRHYLKPHQKRPDVDNLAKGLLDALYSEDAHIYDIRVSKYWAHKGLITIEQTPFILTIRGIYV